MNNVYERAKAHLYSIIPDDLDEMYDTVEMTDEPLVNVYRVFLHEYGIDPAKERGVAPSFSHWMQGLPSALNVEFRTYEIEEIVKDWIESEDIERSEIKMDKVEDYYFMTLTAVVMKEIQDILKKDKKRRWYRDTEEFTKEG